MSFAIKIISGFEKINLAWVIQLFAEKKIIQIDTISKLAVDTLERAKMPPFKGLPKCEAIAKSQGLASMMDFFSVKKKSGRPPQKPSKAGRPSAEKSPAPCLAPVAAAAEPTPTKVKAKRMSYCSGKGLEKMTKVFTAWEDNQKNPEGERKSMKTFAKVWETLFFTLQTHITSVHSKRIKIGSGVGRAPIIGKAEGRIIADVLIRKDRANQGVGVSGAVDILEQMMPQYSRKQLDASFRDTVRPKFAAELTNPAVVQPTTIKRTAITVEQQWRWHMAKKNTPF